MPAPPSLFSSPRRLILALAGLFILGYAFTVLLYVQFVPDLGLRPIFTTELLSAPAPTDFVTDGLAFQPRDRIVQVGPLGPLSKHQWAKLLKAPTRIEEEVRKLPNLSDPATYPDWLRAKRLNRDLDQYDPTDDEQALWVKLELVRGDGALRYNAWSKLGQLPLRELVPSLLWFLLKASLLLVGAWVWWKKPHEPAAEQFYLMCLVTVGAFIGGYHWSHLVVQPALLLVFMTCAVLLPAASLHFYLLFPRPKAWLARAPRRTIAMVYGIPLAFLAVMVGLFFWLRRLESDGGANYETAQPLWLPIIFTYLGVAATWYLGSIIALVHSYMTVTDPTDRNQVRSILLGALLASLPIGYSLYLTLWDPYSFSAGGATWPMFTASAILTVAYAVSITRYRLMELENLLSTSMDYFVASFLAAALYYAVVFVGTLLFSRYISAPQFSTAVAVSTTVMLLLFLLDQARWRVRKFLDRRFTRQKTQLDLTLQRMGKALEQLVDPPALAQKFLQATTDLLGVTQGAVYLRQGDPQVYRLAGCQGSVPPLGELPPGSPLIDALETGQAVSGQPRPYQPMSPAQKQLQNLGGRLAHPVMQEDRMLAFLLLGPKDPPYRPEDSDLLAAFAQITALALQSAAGHRTIEQLNQELGEKVQKISEQQRRILALQSQLHRQKVEKPIAPAPATETVPVEPKPPAPPTPGGIVGSSDAIQHLLGLVRKVAGTDAAVLLRGESGTGKELLAQAVHESSSRAGKAFIKVHCAALSANLLESELFGHVKGAFTGAHKDKAGRFELADGGTLFLDEIGDISLDVQTKLLRVLQERTIERVGSSEPIRVDVRIITATHQNLETLIRQGRFREDLFYRLNVFPVLVPPLRDRVDDIAELALHFMKQSAQRTKKDLLTIEDDVLMLFKSYSWPGNIRQLENVIERAVVIAEGNALTLHEVPAEIFAGQPEGDELATFAANGNGNGKSHDDDLLGRPLSAHRRERLRLEREELVHALASARGNKAEAARALGMARSTFLSRLKKFGLV
jgi:transcriptional regulator with GAF, ATPase, and Fis domain